MHPANWLITIGRFVSTLTFEPHDFQPWFFCMYMGHEPSSARIVKKLCYYRRTARRTISVKILSSVETSCTANPQQIKVMELEGYSQSTCSKQP